MRDHSNRRLRFEQLEVRRLLAADWTNAVNPLDVNVSGQVSALDALIVINDLNSAGPRPLATKPPQLAGAMVDVNSDGKLSAMDALRIINALNEFIVKPMHLELNLEAIQAQPQAGAGTPLPIFSGATLYKSQVRLEELVEGWPSIQSTMTADASGAFQFTLESRDPATIYRLVATDVLGRSKQVEFTLEAGQSASASDVRLALHFPVDVGSVAPDVKLPNQDGAEVQLSELLKHSAVVLYFYPKDNTPGCSAEALDFSERKEEITALGAKVVGVSLDSVQSHREFADEYNIHFDILSDVDRKVAAAYGVVGELQGSPIAKRTTFIIGQDGMIKEVFRNVNVTIHGEQVITALRNGAAG